ncbi:cyanophycinase [Allocatelliglobosispora scoriae]|uniref:Cyanophycinase n=1 Tax=Allocatelliglobosispora scoriae TaxID=643052 RepID=A0A841BK99_9ACTN|nr:cyanophycinase [Allocatelliglobosispora scoriae]MBB5867433.1 cyanophycinase [Allocatelliglobosispora scoriae]
MTHRRTVLAGALGAATLASLAPATAASAHGAARGSLVLVGGSLAEDNTAVYGEIIRRAGGARARIGVITAASVPPSQDPDAGTPDASNSEANGAYYADLLRAHGAGQATWIPIDLDHIADADSPALAAQVDQMTGFFFGGGDQFRYITTLLHGDAHTDSLVLAAIRRRHARGAVIAGSSAGAQIHQGRDMVTGGESYNALRDGSLPGYFDDPDTSGYWPAGGFGFLTSGLLDTHFTAYGRLGRAITLARTTGHHRVFGLDPNTALIVDAPRSPDEHARVVGEGGISVLDLRDGIRWSYLTEGFRYLPGAWRALAPQRLRPLRPRPDAASVPPSADIFGDDVASGLALALAASRAERATGVTRQDDPRFTVELVKSRRFAAYTADGSTAESFLDLTVRIR